MGDLKISLISIFPFYGMAKHPHQADAFDGEVIFKEEN